LRITGKFDSGRNKIAFIPYGWIMLNWWLLNQQSGWTKFVSLTRKGNWWARLVFFFSVQSLQGPQSRSEEFFVGTAGGWATDIFGGCSWQRKCLANQVRVWMHPTFWQSSTSQHDWCTYISHQGCIWGGALWSLGVIKGYNFTTARWVSQIGSPQVDIQAVGQKYNKNSDLQSKP
jgi:hypothetical protein